MKKVTEVYVKGGAGAGGGKISPPTLLSSSLRAPPALQTNFPFHPTLFNELMAEYFKINSSNLHINYPPSLWWFFQMFLLLSLKIDSKEVEKKENCDWSKNLEQQKWSLIFFLGQNIRPSCSNDTTKFPQHLLSAFRVQLCSYWSLRHIRNQN